MKITPASHRTGAWRRIAALAGEPTAPPGSTPAPDCCEPGEVPPDRAHEETSNAVALTTVGTPAFVQVKTDDSFGFDATVTLDAAPTAGNILVAVVSARNSIGAVFTPSGTGWTSIRREYTGATVGDWPMEVFWRTVAGGDGSVWSCDGPSDGFTFVVVELSGVGAPVEDIGLSGETGAGTDDITPGVTDPIILLSAVSVRSDAGVDFTAAGGMTERADISRDSGDGPQTGVNTQVVSTPSGSYTIGSTGGGGSQKAFIGVAFGTGTPTWSLPAPLAVDDDDATYHTVTGKTDLLRIDLGAAYRIVRTRIRIATTTSGARVITIKGANLADFSDEVTLDTIAFTATGGLTAQDVTGLWDTDTSYRFFELSIGTSDTYRVHSWELYEQTPGTIVVTNPADGDAVDELQDVLDDIYDAINAPTMRWEAVTDGEDVFVWVGDDLVHEFKEYV